MARWLVVVIAGCTKGATPEAPASVAGSTDGFRCPEGMVHTVEAPGAGANRTAPDTEVHTCLDPAGNLAGPHLERWPGGGVAAEGSWAGGARDGVWTAWFPDGAFRWQTSWHAGVQHGTRREIADDGRIVEIDITDGRAGAIRSLPADTPMPEWDGGARVDGGRYRSHLGATLAP